MMHGTIDVKHFFNDKYYFLPILESRLISGVFSLIVVEMCLLASQCQSVHLFAYNNSRRVERISMKYDIEAFY
jgi:hypothetical protein